MSKPMLLIFHPEASVTEALQKLALAIGARVRVVSDAGTLPAEVRQFGPDVVFLPLSSGPEGRDGLVNLIREDAPLARIVLLTAGEDPGMELPSGVFGHIQVWPSVAGVPAVEMMRKSAAAFRSQGTVLVVEDQPVNLEMVADVLQARGYRVMRAMTAEAAIELAGTGGPDMILMDIYLPGMNGIEAVRKLKSMPSATAIPIVMLSASGNDSTVTEALESGAIDFVIKPFSPRRLLDKIAQVLEKRELLAHA